MYKLLVCVIDRESVVSTRCHVESYGVVGGHKNTYKFIQQKIEGHQKDADSPQPCHDLIIQICLLCTGHWAILIRNINTNRKCFSLVTNLFFVYLGI